MKYDFDTVVDRSGTSSVKWDKNVLKSRFGNEDTLPFWIADMDVACAPKITEAMVKRAEHGVYGYTTRCDDYYDAVIGWMKRRHGYTVEKEWIVFTPGVVPAFSIALNAYCEKGDKVIIQPPVYHPFGEGIKVNGLEALNNNLIYKDGRFEVDFENLEELAKDPKAKLFILCNPHNPGGRVFTADELRRMADICLKNDVLIIDDEIHHDIIFEGHKHVALPTLGKEIEDITVVLTAPSKTFNIAGLASSNVFIRNEKLREKFNAVINCYHISNQNPFGLEAVKVAYNECADWVDEMVSYMGETANFMDRWLKENLPTVKLVKPEGSYLCLLDFNYYTDKDIDICGIVHKKAGVGLMDGSVFGENGKGFMRICFGCPRSLVEAGLKRIKAELDKISC